jgi:hypothetical protein
MFVGRSRRWWPILVTAALIGAASQSTSTAQTVGVPQGTPSANVQTGRIGPGRVIEVPSSNEPFMPARDQIEARERALSSHPAPPLGPHTDISHVRGSGGPPTSRQ